MGNRILVIGGNHQNPLGVIEAFGQKGFLADAIILEKGKKSFVLKSKFIDRGWICQTEEDVISTILSNFTDTCYKAVAVACCDDAANILDAHYEELKSVLIIPTVKNAGSLILWTNKEKMTETAKSLGITVPASWLIKDTTIPDNIIYPCVIKPITSVKHGKAGFAKCTNSKELQACLDAKKEGEPVQVQQFIERDFEFQFLGCSLNCGEEIIIPGRTHIEKTTGFNNLVFLKYDKYDSSFDKTVEGSKRFIRVTGYSGLFSVEYMRGKDGKDYFLEMNFRNDGNGIAVTSSGTNLPYIWYLYASGGNYHSEVDKSEVKTTFMMPEFSYFISMLNGDVSFKKWFSDRQKATCYVTRFKDDTGPLCSLIWWQKKAIIQAAFFKLLRGLHLYSFAKRIKHFGR